MWLGACGSASGTPSTKACERLTAIAAAPTVNSESNISLSERCGVRIAKLQLAAVVACGLIVLLAASAAAAFTASASAVDRGRACAVPVACSRLRVRATGLLAAQRCCLPFPRLASAIERLAMAPQDSPGFLSGNLGVENPGFPETPQGAWGSDSDPNNPK